MRPAAEMMAAHYQDFLGVAGRVLGRDARVLHMQPTDLAHEAAIRIAGFQRLTVDGHLHFLSLSARVMHQVLIDEIRRKRAHKRQTPTLATQWVEHSQERLSAEAVSAALTKLEQISPLLASIVERRFFFGLTFKEIAADDDISESTVKRQWCAARAWLAAEMQGG